MKIPTNYKEVMVDLSPRNGYEPYIIRDKIHVRLPSKDLANRLDGLQAVESKWNFMTRQTLTESQPSIRIDLSQNSFDKF